MRIEFKGVSVTVTDRATGQRKTILNDAHGFAQPGRLLSIMGPSGAGKSTLVRRRRGAGRSRHARRGRLCPTADGVSAGLLSTSRSMHCTITFPTPGAHVCSRSSCLRNLPEGWPRGMCSSASLPPRLPGPPCLPTSHPPLPNVPPPFPAHARTHACTQLDVLAANSHLSSAGSSVEGALLVNGAPRSTREFGKISCYVQQKEVLLSSATVSPPGGEGAGRTGQRRGGVQGARRPRVWPVHEVGVQWPCSREQKTWTCCACSAACAPLVPPPPPPAPP